MDERELVRPCLRHAYSYDENGDDDLYICAAPDGHEGAHEFVPTSNVTVQVKEGVSREDLEKALGI